jgi:hypothetical protein
MTHHQRVCLDFILVVTALTWDLMSSVSESHKIVSYEFLNIRAQESVVLNNVLPAGVEEKKS